MKKRLGPYFQPAEPSPIPPSELVLQTGASSKEQFEQMFQPGYGFPYRYRSVGKGVLLNWIKHLERYSFNIRTMGSVLEFGCGTGRLLQHFRNIEGIRIVGTDANPQMAEWCSKNLTGCEFHCNDLNPPLTFAEDNSFDLVYAFSVFTHIPAEHQEAWLLEMKRILKPGGFLVCTVAGWWLRHLFVAPKDLDTLASKGCVEYTSQDERASLSTQVGGSGWDIYQTRQEVINVFGKHLRLLDYLPDSHDVIILQKE
jgi:SAM-dependent methyltransferase